MSGGECRFIVERGATDIDPDGGVFARPLLQELGHAVRHTANGRGHPEVAPRNLEANGIVVDHRHATAPVVQLGSKRTAPATE